MNEVTGIVLENKRIADDIYSLTFSASEHIPVRCGQFCMVGVHGFPLRRPIAICKAEGERITVCYQLKGEGTRTLASTYKPGEKLSVLFPLGNGFYVKDTEKKVAVVGGGVGVFPLIAAIREYSKTKQIYTYMGFRTKSPIASDYDLKRGEKCVIATDDGSFGYHGTAVQALMEDIGKIKPDVILSCGPTPMLRALKHATSDMGIPVYVSLEERMGCGIGACLVCVCNRTNGEHARVCKDGPVFEIGEVNL